MEAKGGLWLRPFLSAWSLTETGPNCTGSLFCAAAGSATSSAPNTPRDAPEKERVLRNMKKTLQGSAFLTWLASLLAFWRKGLAWCAMGNDGYLVRSSLPLLVRR